MTDETLAGKLRDLYQRLDKSYVELWNVDDILNLLPKAASALDLQAEELALAKKERADLRTALKLRPEKDESAALRSRVQELEAKPVITQESAIKLVGALEGWKARALSAEKVCEAAQDHVAYQATYLNECRECDPTVGFTCPECSITSCMAEALSDWRSTQRDGSGM